MHATSEPAILYLGTPVVLISTTNADGSYNLAPMSSAFWLGWRCMLGLAAESKTTENMKRTGEWSSTCLPPTWWRRSIASRAPPVPIPCPPAKFAGAIASNATSSALPD